MAASRKTVENTVATEGVVGIPAKKEAPRFIKDYPRIKCVVESRDENEVDLPIGINEYTAYIQFGKEIEIPEPVYDMIKGLKTVKFEKDENGFTKSKEINRYIVSKV